MSKKRPLVLVTWKDAKSEASGWKSIDEVSCGHPATVTSVGWIVRQTKNKLIIVSSIVGDHCDGDTTIPMGWVQSIKPLVPKP
jgi:hypothetical protein